MKTTDDTKQSKGDKLDGAMSFIDGRSEPDVAKEARLRCLRYGSEHGRLVSSFRRRRSSAQTPLVQFVVNLLYNNSVQQIHNKSKTTQHVHNKSSTNRTVYNKSTTS